MKDYYSKNEIDQLVNYLFEHGNEFIEDAISHELPAYKYEFPAFFQKWDYFREFEILIMFLGAHELLGEDDVILTGINVPGCSAYGTDKKEGILNFFRAFFECEDYRHVNKMFKRNRVSFPFNSYGLPSNDIAYVDLIDEICNSGWRIGHKAHYNTIIVSNNSSSKLTVTIPNWNIIPGSLHLLIRRWLTASNVPEKRQFQIKENDYWHCDACGGSSDVGCLMSDPQSCVRI